MSSSSSSLDAATTLRTAQKPLKDRYRSDPSAALVTLTATGTLDATSNLTCTLGSSSATAAKRIAGMHAATGGPTAPDVSSEQLCSGDMLLESLVACFGVTVRAVATSMGVAVAGGSVTAEGALDFRGTLGVKAADGASVGVGFQTITLRVRLEVADEDRAQVDRLIELSERYCVVLQTLRNGVKVRTELAHVGKALPDARGNNVEEGGGKGGTNGAGGGSDEPGLEDDEILKLN